MSAKRTQGGRGRGPRRGEASSVAGFTLIELMVAMTAGLIAITAIYTVASASSRHFHEQQRLAQTQSAVRLAMEQLRRDLQRAGFLGTPNSRREVRCVTPPQEIAALEYLSDFDSANLPQGATNGVKADRLRLVGNYATGDSYLAVGVDGTGSTIFLQRQWQAFRRDFGVQAGPGSGDFPYDPDRFRDVFRPGRFLHVTTQQNRHFFVRITGVDPTQASISFAPSLGVGGACVGGLADGAIVAPLARIEYAVVDLTADAVAGSQLAPPGGRVDPANDFLGRSNVQFVRREVAFDGDTATPVPGSERVVLEYVAFVDYRFVVDREVNTGLPPDLVTLAGAAAQNYLQNDPEDARSVVVTLAARTAEQDPRFPWVPTGAGNPALGVPPSRYRVHGGGSGFQGAARVRSLRAEIVLPNLAHRGMR